MDTKKHLFVGYGDIASRCASHFLARGDRVCGIARTAKTCPDGLDLWEGDAKSEAILEGIGAGHFDSVVFTLTPDHYDEAGYTKAYYEVVDKVLERLEAAGAESRVLFVSSSSVYGQQSGETVDELSETKPSSGTAKVLLDTEARLHRSPLVTSVVRFSGIYGPGRDFLLRQVWQRLGGDGRYTNRIHIDDCVGVICYLLTLDSGRLHPLYLASDKTPVTAREVRGWLALQLGIDPAELSEPETKRQANKKCLSDRLAASGYRFKYPDFREGYRESVARFLAQNR